MKYFVHIFIIVIYIQYMSTTVKHLVDGLIVNFYNSDI